MIFKFYIILYFKQQHHNIRIALDEINKKMRGPNLQL